MPAVLEEEQIDPFLQGNLHQFGPSSAPLRHLAANIFLKPEKPLTNEGDQGIPGKLVLGNTFNWGDMVVYALGIGLGALGEWRATTDHH